MGGRAPRDADDLGAETPPASGHGGRFAIPGRHAPGPFEALRRAPADPVPVEIARDVPSEPTVVPTVTDVSAVAAPSPARSKAVNEVVPPMRARRFAPHPPKVLGP